MRLYSANGFDEILIGGTYRGVVKGVKDFGLFVRIDNSGVTGLAHVSKIEHFGANKQKYVLNAGVVVRVSDLNATDKKVSLEIHDADQALICQQASAHTVHDVRGVGTAAPSEKEKELFEYWGLTDKRIIGYYHRDESRGLYVVDDIRKTNFDPIPYYPNDELQKPVKMYFDRELRGIKLNEYYVFTWKFSNREGKNPYEIWIDHSVPITPIVPKPFIETLFADRYNDKSKNFGSATNFLDTLSKQLTASDSTFVYELLQNANDYPQAGKSVDVVFEVSDSYLLFSHSGRVFDARNISGICGINEREKSANRKAIGYKGIGFKTVFQIAHYVYIRTGDYSFRFEEKAKKIKRLQAPWPILPIWTMHEEVADEVNRVFDKGAHKYPVQIALRPEQKSMLHEGRRCYERLLEELFADSNVILFVPNISSVRVVVGGQEVRVCVKDESKWQVDWFSKDLPLEFQLSVNKTVDAGKSRIPEKYKDFAETQVAFACRHADNVIEPIPNANLYCYLPTSASWGFPFLMNTDMIPKGDRNDIESEVKLLDENETNFNEQLAAVAGGLFFEWIHGLLVSDKYELGSVYSLIPDFAQCVREHKNYETFITRFQVAFETRMENEPIIVLEDGPLARFHDAVLDTTGLTSSGIMTDEEFHAISKSSRQGRLPAKCVRADSRFTKFHTRYCNEDLIFSWESLHASVRTQGFKEWLKVQENNNKFLKFLLDRGCLEDFFGEEMFIDEESGDLFKAADLYYDIDQELSDLQAFSWNFLYLSRKTRAFFAENKKWNEVCRGAFDTFNAADVIENALLSDEKWDETVRLLHTQETSLHFYQFLAKREIKPTRLKDLPFFTADQSVFKNFKDAFVFLDSAEGQATCRSAWLSSVPFAFVLSEYGELVNDFLKLNAGVRVFSGEVIVNDIILSEDYGPKVNAAQQTNFEVSKAFLDYCFEHRENFGKGACLSQYALRAANGRGKWDWILPEDHVYFASATYDELSRRKWLGADWMYCLDNGYWETGASELKDFIHEKFDVEELSPEKFYREVVRRHAKDIVANTSGDSDPDGEKNFDFVAYLDDNHDLIFNQEKDADKFNGLVVIVDDGHGGCCKVDHNQNHVYLHDETLKEIVESLWFPKGLVSVCSSRYGASKALESLGVGTFKISTFFDDVIKDEFSAITRAVNTKEKSIAFHAFVIANKKDLTENQTAVMKGAPVYLYGHEDPSDVSSGHQVLSSKARELQERGLVEFSALDIISPDYHPEEHADYWETLLENTKFTVVDFVNWTKDNQDAFRERIQNVDRNVAFWRWLNESEVSDETLKALPSLPVCLKGGAMANTDSVVYLSDAYIQGGGIEALVKNFNPNAAFVGTTYLAEGDDVEFWRAFWIRLGLRFDILGILKDAIDHRLGEIEDPQLVSLIAVNRSELVKTYGDSLPAKLASLRLQSRDGRFRSLREVIYVDCYGTEPFPCVELPNQVSYATADERKLIADVLAVVGGSKIDTVQSWRQAKISRYLEIQNDVSQIDHLRTIHHMFVNELAELFNRDHQNLEFSGDTERERLVLVRKVLFLDRQNRFVPAEGLTEGSSYVPFCDFERCGLKYEYLSNSYKTSCSQDVRKMLNSVFRIHCDFREQDIPQLEDRTFAIYFWKDYLPNAGNISKSRISGLIEDKDGKRKFDSVACIPTKDHMKRPGDVYSMRKELAFFVNAVEDAENKIPLKELPEVEYESGKTLFGLLLNKKENLQLSFKDALYALFKIVGQDKRSQLLRWMIDSYDPKYKDCIDRYRADGCAKWKNTKNEDVHITQLYALAHDDRSLEQSFGTLPQIINKGYLPCGGDFEKACAILGVTVIRKEDVIVDPRDKLEIDIKTTLKIQSLALAYCVAKTAWKSRYDLFKHLIDRAGFCRCSAISLRYNQDVQICNERKMFYRAAGSPVFCFVESVDNPRVFKSFVESFVQYLELKEEVDSDLVESIMVSEQSAEEWLQENNDLMVDDDFLREMESLRPGASRRFVGNKAAEDDFVDDGGHHVITVQKEESTSVFEDGEGLPASDSQTDCESSEADLLPAGSGDDVDTPEHPKKKEPSPRCVGSTERTSKQAEIVELDLDIGDKVPKTCGSANTGTRYAPRSPKPFSAEDVERLRSHAKPRLLSVLEPTQSEISDLKGILDGSLTPEQIADQNYLARLRLYRNLTAKGMHPVESEKDFVKNGANRVTDSLSDGKYIHSCSAAGGILYLSPAIWNKIASGKCVVCVYLGAKANDFMYFRSVQEILDWIKEDDIVIKLTGEEKARTVEKLYTTVLSGVKGTAYTMLRIESNERYDSLFAPLDLTTVNYLKESEDDFG